MFNRFNIVILVGVLLWFLLSLYIWWMDDNRYVRIIRIITVVTAPAKNNSTLPWRILKTPKVYSIRTDIMVTVGCLYSLD